MEFPEVVLICHHHLILEGDHVGTIRKASHEEKGEVLLPALFFMLIWAQITSKRTFVLAPLFLLSRLDGRLVEEFVL